MRRTYGRNTNQTRLTLGESKQLRKLAQNVDTLAQLTDSTGLDEKQFQAVLFELGLDLNKMLKLLENKIDVQELRFSHVSSGDIELPEGIAHTWNSFEWVNTVNWSPSLEVSQIQFDTENGNSY